MDSLLGNEPSGTPPAPPVPPPPVAQPPSAISPIGAASASESVSTAIGQLPGLSPSSMQFPGSDIKTAGPQDAETWKQQFIAILNTPQSNAVAALGNAWNYDTNRDQIRQLIINAMALYYNQSPEDNVRLNKILEIAHELKPNCLAELFNLQQLPFVIDLACLAQRREFLKLDKFLSDKLTSSDGGEAFARHLLSFLKRKCPGIGANPIPSETFQIIFSVLKDHGNAYPFITTELHQLAAQIRAMQGKTEPRLTPLSSQPSFSPFTFLDQTRTRTPISSGLPPGSAHMMRPGQVTMPMGGALYMSSQMQQAKMAGPYDSPQTTFTEDVQNEANFYFQQIYSQTGGMAVRDFVQKLKSMKETDNPKEKDLLACVIKNLFDEYRFFSEYPVRELKTTAELYGSIVRESLIPQNDVQFARAMKKIIESLQADVGSPLWNFAVWTLTAASPSLYKYPKVCQVVVGIPSFPMFDQELKEYLQAGAQGTLPTSHRDVWPTQSSMVSQPAVAPIGSTSVSGMKFAPKQLSGFSISNVTNVDTLINATQREGTQIGQPSQVVFEKVFFVCNNLSQTNLVKKTEEIKELIAENGDDFVKWLAQYLVMKRVTVEQNFQPLYNNFLLSISNSTLSAIVLRETYRNIGILLRSDKRQAASNFGDRQLLKNLGHWLGLITIGRDKAILSKDLDLKALLVEAFYKGQQELLYVVPFVVKVLSASSKSTVFGPNCAWVYGIVKVLVEIHNEPDLKLNLKFEIEVLCKELNIDLRGVEVGNYLKDQSRLPKLLPLKQDALSPTPKRLPPGSMLSEGGADAGRGSVPASVGASLFARKPESPATTLNIQGQIQQRLSSQPAPVPVFHYNDINIHSTEGLVQLLKDPAQLPLFQAHPQLKVLCRTAIVQAIKELIGGIAERSINVAITVTEHICKKDFMLNPDEQQLRRSAHQMMRAMTAGMAAISCRDPLSATISCYLKQALQSHLNQLNVMHQIGGLSASANITLEQQRMIEEATAAVTEANLEVAKNFIVKSACEKAVMELEKRLDSEYGARRMARAENRPFQGSAIPAHVLEKIPEQLRLKMGALSEKHLKIYDDFSSKVCGFKPLAPEDVMLELARRGPVAPSSRIPGVVGYPSIGENIRPGSVLTVPTPAERTQFMPYGHALLEEGGPRGGEDPGLQAKVESILREWINLCYSPITQRDQQSALGMMVKLMHDKGVLSTDEMISKFFKMSAEICLDVSYRLLKNDSTGQSTVVRQRCYYTLDAFVKLTCLMVKYSDGSQTGSSQSTSTKVNLLKKVLGILTTALHEDHERRKTDFNGMPFHRILIVMFNELTLPDPVLDPIAWEIMESFGQALFSLQPRRAPGFAFHWLDIIGNRNFIGRLLAESPATMKTGAIYTQLMLCHMKFLAPFLRNVRLPKPVAFIYKGTLRILLVILHDFPEILCEYHYVLCDVIPPNCVQLRNLVLSAYPREMRLPDPFTQSMEAIENTPEMSKNPKVHREMSVVIPTELCNKLDDYLATRSSVKFLSDLPSYLQVSQEPGSKYNFSVMNAVVMYVGVKAIDSIHEKNHRISMSAVAHTPFMDIFQNLAVSLCTEGRYLLFNGIANQLRYPNTHTHYFSCVLLYLFLEANSEVIQEQITRILFERLVALRPHPWGLLITFIELIRNDRYGFWGHDFVRCAPEIQRLFMSVASSCSVTSSINPSEQTNGVGE